MEAFLFAFGCIMLAVILLRVAAGCKRTVELTRDWTQEKSVRNRERTAKAGKILTGLSIGLVVAGILGAVLLVIL